MKNSSRATAFFVFFIDNFGLAIIFPFIAPLILDHTYGFFPQGTSLAAKNLYLGIALAAFPFAQFFGSPFFGDLADQIGRKKVLFLTIFGTLIGFLISGLGAVYQKYWVLLGGRLFAGFAAGNAAICLAALSDLAADEKERARDYGIISLLGGVSWVLGILVGGLSSQTNYLSFLGPHIPFFTTVVLTAISLVVVHFCFTETFAPKGRQKINLFTGAAHIVKAFTMRNLRALYLIYFVWFLSWVMGMEWFTPIAIQEYKVSQLAISLSLAGTGVTWSLGSSVVNNFLVKRLPIYRITLSGLFFVSLFVTLVALQFSYIYISVMYGVATIFAAYVWSNSMNLIADQAGKEEQGTAMGVGMSMQALGWVLGPLLGTLLANGAITSIYWVAAGLSFAAFFGLFSLKKRFTQTL